MGIISSNVIEFKTITKEKKLFLIWRLVRWIRVIHRVNGVQMMMTMKDEEQRLERMKSMALQDNNIYIKPIPNYIVHL